MILRRRMTMLRLNERVNSVLGNLKIWNLFLRFLDKKIILERRAINPPIFLFCSLSIFRAWEILFREWIRARVYTYMFVYNGANHETHGDHISRHGETQNQKAISVAFVRCQLHSRLLPVAGETENVERQTVFRFKRANGFLWIPWRSSS